jgi:tetratricopeptide (TPR) repeat protein
MIGEDRADILQIDAQSKSSSTGSSKKKKDEGADVVILGYDGDAPVGVQTKPAKAKASNKREGASVLSHLFCLKDTCRFFMKKEGACKFDSAFEMSQEHSKKIDQVEQQAKRIENVELRLDGLNKLDQLDKLEKLQKIDAVDEILSKITDVQALIKKAETADKTGTKITKELDKFWKFQTKSVSELIASLGDAEQKQEKSLNEIKTQLDKSFESWKPDVDLKPVEDVKDNLAQLREAIETRDDGIENFSTTVSELVLNIDDTLKVLQGKNDLLTERLQNLESSVSQFDTSIEKMEKSISKTFESGSNQEVSKEISSLDGKFQSRFDDVVGAHERIAQDLSKWRDDFGKKSDDHRDSWQKSLKRIEQKQSEVMELVRKSGGRSEDETTQLKKKEAKKFNNLGVTSFHNGEYELARDQFLEAVDLDSEFAESWNNLGLVYTELEDDPGAREAFSRAIEINPDLPAAYNNLGYIFYKQENYDRAIEMYDEAINRSADNSSAYTNLGNAYFKLGNRDDARSAWEKALEIDPANEKAGRNLNQLNKE